MIVSTDHSFPEHVGADVVCSATPDPGPPRNRVVTSWSLPRGPLARPNPFSPCPGGVGSPARAAVVETRAVYRLSKGTRVCVTPSVEIGVAVGRSGVQRDVRRWKLLTPAQTRCQNSPEPQLGRVLHRRCLTRHQVRAQLCALHAPPASVLRDLSGQVQVCHPYIIQVWLRSVP